MGDRFGKSAHFLQAAVAQIVAVCVVKAVHECAALLEGKSLILERQQQRIPRVHRLVAQHAVHEVEVREVLVVCPDREGAGPDIMKLLGSGNFLSLSAD
ncbi:hypothetical protein O9X99_23740 [Agrobacterium salinitolerans]|nr:hypothetical protein [Agrobacterium salinitolerans]MCZ7894684.1 hypothetical protein [Agrobacterium salinitolerans]